MCKPSTSVSGANILHKKMALHNELPVYKATYDLLLEIFKFTKEFGKEYKYTVGENLKKQTIDLLTLIYRANSRKDISIEVKIQFHWKINTLNGL